MEIKNKKSWLKLAVFSFVTFSSLVFTHDIQAEGKIEHDNSSDLANNEVEVNENGEVSIKDIVEIVGGKSELIDDDENEVPTFNAILGDDVIQIKEGEPVVRLNGEILPYLVKESESGIKLPISRGNNSGVSANMKLPAEWLVENLGYDYDKKNNQIAVISISEINKKKEKEKNEREKNKREEEKKRKQEEAAEKARKKVEEEERRRRESLEEERRKRETLIQENNSSNGDSSLQNYGKGDIQLNYGATNRAVEISVSGQQFRATHKGNGVVELYWVNEDETFEVTMEKGGTKSIRFESENLGGFVIVEIYLD